MISVEFIPPSTSNWKLFGESIYGIEKSLFGDKSLAEDWLRSDINDLKTMLVLLKDDNSIVGFTYAVPESEEIARIVDTTIAKKYQGRGMVVKLINCLEEELKRRGYKYMTRDAMVENGYADKIEKNYSSRIVEMWNLDSQWGKQRHFKIKI